MRFSLAVIKFSTACAVLAMAVNGLGQEKAEKITYDDHVKVILQTKCATCHNANKKSSGLDLSNYTNLMLGGSSGEVIAPGSAEDSYLYMLITHESEPTMPPKSPKMADEIIATIGKWIDGGALENSGSKAIIKPKVDLKMEIPADQRPEVLPVPKRLSLEPVLRTKRSGPAYSIATSPWAPLVAIAGQQQILLYDTQKLELIGVIPFPEGIPQILKFSRSGGLLLAGGGVDGASGKVVVFDVTTGERVIEVGDELDTVLAADISSDQGLIALGGPQRVVRVYSTVDGSLAYELTKHTDWIYALEFSPDSVLLATGDRAGNLHVWEAYTGREYLTLKGHTACVTGVSWRIDSNVVASASEDVTVRLWEMENGREIKRWNAHGGGTRSLEYTRDGRIVTCGRDKTTKIWDQNGAQQRAFPAFADIALSCSFCDESSRVIAGDWTGEIRVWNAADGVQLSNLTANPEKLDERLTAATAELTAATQEHQKRTTAYAAAAKAVTDATTNLNNTQTALAADAAKMKETATQLTDVAAKLTAENAKLTANTAVAARLDKALPLVGEALASANKAIAAAGDDKELKDVAAKLTAVQTKRKAELDGAKAAMVVAKTAVDTLTKSQLAYQDTAKKLEVTSAKYKVDIDAMTKAMVALKANAATAKTALDEYTPQLAAAQQSQKRWQDEKAFSVAIATLLSQQSEVLELVATRAQSHADMLAAVTSVASEMTAAKQKMDVATLAATTATELKTTLDGQVKKGITDLAAAEVVIKTLDAKAKSLTTVIAGLDAAKKALAGTEAVDAQVKALAQTITETMVAKQADLTKANTDLAAQKTNVEKLKVANVELKKAFDVAVVKETEAKANLTAADTAFEAATAKHQEAVKQADAAKQQLDLAEGELTKVEEQIGAMRQRTS